MRYNKKRAHHTTNATEFLVLTSLVDEYTENNFLWFKDPSQTKHSHNDARQTTALQASPIKKIYIQKDNSSERNTRHSAWSEKSDIGLCRGAGELDSSESFERRCP